MRNLFYALFVCVVRCDVESNNYYVIEMPENDPMPSKPFNVYWNVPTMQCRSKNIPFNNLHEKYGIVQNDKDEFRGEKITIMYEPGFFPALFKNESSGKYRFRNGGVPQEGDLQEHLRIFRQDIDEIVPDENFDGMGIIDFESWRPVFRQNFGTLEPYKDVSYEVEKKLHPWWPKSWLESEAKRRFEESARQFMQKTLSVAKQMRPKARWGYYGFPHCFNMAKNNMNERCSNDVNNENDKIQWLWTESTALLPSIYRARDLSQSQLAAMVRGRVAEAARVMRRDTQILPYFWFKYRDGGFITEGDLSAILTTLYKSEASGFIIWGSSNDVNTVDKCQKLRTYVEKVLGPAVAKYTVSSNKLQDEMPDTTTDGIDIVDKFNYTTSANDRVENINSSESDVSTTASYAVIDKVDPEMIWIPPANYSDDISRSVEEELKKRGHNGTISDNKELQVNKMNESIIFSIIMDLVTNTRGEFEVNSYNKPLNNNSLAHMNYLVDIVNMESKLDNYHIASDDLLDNNVNNNINDTLDVYKQSNNNDSTISSISATTESETSNTNVSDETDTVYDLIFNESNFEFNALNSSDTTLKETSMSEYDIKANNSEELIFIDDKKFNTQNDSNVPLVSDFSLNVYLDITTETLNKENEGETPSYDSTTNPSDQIIDYIYHP